MSSALNPRPSILTSFLVLFLKKMYISSKKSGYCGRRDTALKKKLGDSGSAFMNI